jgi:alpha-tubulin suppressor-like RCC1 family protein
MSSRVFVVGALLMAQGCLPTRSDAVPSDATAPIDLGGTRDSGGVDDQGTIPDLGSAGDSGRTDVSGESADVGDQDATDRDANDGDCASGHCAVPGLSAGPTHTCAIQESGSVVCWGSNLGGALGDGSIMRRPSPVTVLGLTDAVEVGCGQYFSCARRSDGTVVCWGGDSYGLLGDGTTPPRLAPVAVVGVTDAVELSVGYRFACARRRGGTVVCWGNNESGQLGDGSFGEPHLTPVTVSGLIDAVEIGAGAFHACARQSSGGVVCWGNDDHGQIGDERDPRMTHVSVHLTPVAVTGLANAVEIAVGDIHSCARLSSGAVVCWGANRAGEHGAGPSTFRTTLSPPMVGLTDAVEIACGGAHSCARRRNGLVVCSGLGFSGQLGNGESGLGVESRTPVAVMNLTDVVAIALGGSHSCARRRDGAVLCWGSNPEGQVGDGSTVDRSTPVRVQGL